MLTETPNCSEFHRDDFGKLGGPSFVWAERKGGGGELYAVCAILNEYPKVIAQLNCDIERIRILDNYSVGGGNYCWIKPRYFNINLNTHTHN